MKNLKKRLVVIGVSIMTAALIGGCGVKADIEVKDNTLAMDSITYYTAKEFDLLQTDENFNNDDYELIKIGTNEFFKKKEKTHEAESFNEINKEYGAKILGKDKIILPLNPLSDIDLRGIGLGDGLTFIDIKVKVPFKITYTNGTKLDDNTVATDRIELKNLIILGNKKYETGTNISVKVDRTKRALENKQIFGYYDIVSNLSGITQLNLDSADGVLTTAYQISPKGTKYEFNPYGGCWVARNLHIKVINDKSFARAEDGKYTLHVETMNGNSKDYTYYVDVTNPTVKVVNERIKCIDKKKNGYASGIRFIKVNNKVVKNRYKVKKGDIIVVADKADNFTKMTVK